MKQTHSGNLFLFKRKSSFLASHDIELVKTFPFMHHLPCNVGLIDIDEAKVISALQHKSKYKLKFNFDLFEMKFEFLGFHAVILVKTFPLMYHLLI